MAGSVTLNVTPVPGGGGVLQHQIVWTSDASGNVNGDSLTLASGSVARVDFIPGTGNSQPTNAYNVDLLGPEGFSLFDGGSGTSIGASLSNTTASQAAPFIHGAATTYVRSWFHGGAGNQLTVTGAGNAKSGTVNIYIMPGVV
jgi:hypothetical protein